MGADPLWALVGRHLSGCYGLTLPAARTTALSVVTGYIVRRNARTEVRQVKPTHSAQGAFSDLSASFIDQPLGIYLVSPPLASHRPHEV
jgi:hypothetical protein